MTLYGYEEPRVWTKPLRPLTPATSRGFEACEFASDVLGVRLLPWQRWLLVHALELNPDGRFRFRTVLVLVARQNGKTLLVNVLALWRMFVDLAGLVIGTAQNLDVAEEAWTAAVDMVEGVPDLKAEVEHIDKTNGKKALRLAPSADAPFTRRYKVQAANRRGGRGLSGDLVVLDELREHQRWDAWAAVTKTTMARDRPQTWALSNAGDASSVVLVHLRNTALAQIESGATENVVGLFDWSAPDGADIGDMDALAQANPSLGYLIPEDALVEASRTDPESTFRVECMCQFVDEVDARPLLFPLWAKRHGAEVPAPGARMALGMDTGWDRSATWIAAATELPDGRVRAEIVATGPGQGWVRGWLFGDAPSRMTRLAPVAVAMQASGAPVSTLHEELGLHALAEHREALRGLTAADMARASGLVFDLVDRDGIAIVEHPALDAAAADAVAKPMSDAWVIDRKKSGSDASPLVALSAAVLALLGHSEPDNAPPNCW